ncbi:unnamed protein product [Paramecium octaurelia]|uniref:Uncharacterized protein n=1 Tax=Paramecium octaurelia TaxID=43137 RepID=A0A8S1UXG1_PAROT|nr:unnamed protein product [Paramecium octaurelia]
MLSQFYSMIRPNLQAENSFFNKKTEQFYNIFLVIKEFYITIKQVII